MQAWSQLLSPPGRDVLSGEAPKPLVEMASRGLAPLPPTDVVVCLIHFLIQGEERLRDNALTAHKNLPAKIETHVLEEMSTRELGDPAMTWVDNFLALAVEHSLSTLIILWFIPMSHLRP